jgi:hypothetical protein
VAHRKVLTTQNSDQLESKVRDAMDTYMRSHGFKTVDELHSRVEQILSGDALRNWEELKKSCVDTLPTRLVKNTILTFLGKMIVSAPVILSKTSS